MNWIGKHWYKVLAVVLLTYVISAGFLVPLRPGLMKTDTFRVEVGEQISMEIQAYNTWFTRADHIRVWLRLSDDFSLLANNVEVQNDRVINAAFNLPPQLPIAERVNPASVIVDTEVDGSMVLPDAISIVGEVDGGIDREAWLETPVENLSMKWKYAFPWRNILEETIRNTYFHVPMWFGMMLLFLLSAFYSIKLLRTDDHRFDSRVFSLNLMGTVFGLLGIFTGAIWARFTWGSYWSGDIKQDMSAITLLIFMAYFLLRNAMDPGKKRGRVTAVYTLFAFAASIPLLYIIPRMQPSLHPGSGGNPGLGGEDLDNTMKTIFYPAVIGWMLLGYWLSDIVYRLSEIRNNLLRKNN